VVQAAIVENVPAESTAHPPVAPVQLYIVGAGGTHDSAQLVFDSVPDPAVHVFVAGSVHV
jgi:hypothetical protein